MMQPYESLTDRGKLTRLRKLALCALDQYDIPYSGLKLVGVYTNTLFRVVSQDGDSYLLRVCRPGWRTDVDLFSEALWLQALNRDTDIGAPLPVPTRNGSYVVQAGVPGVPEIRRVTLMSWISGSPLVKNLTEGKLFDIGVLFARLHQHAARFSPPAGFTTQKMDRVLARGEPDVLFSDDCRMEFSLRTREIVENTRLRVEAGFAERYAEADGLRVIHNDLWHGNIKLYRGRLHPLDFEDTIWGFPVQDLAMAVQDLMKDVPQDLFNPLFRALRAGYESLNAWPERYAGEMDLFRVGRMLWVANYVARFERQYLRQHLERVTKFLERFLETGELNLYG